MTEKLYLNPKEAELLSGIPERTLRNWRSADTGPPYVKPAGRVLYPKQALINWIEGKELVA